VSRIYIVTHAKNESLIRFVRAKTLNGAVRALASELFEAKAASAEDIVKASKDGSFDVLDALDEAQPSAA
jgi:hypothetical protein